MALTSRFSPYLPNGTFVTGDLSDWTESGNTIGTSVSVAPAYAHSGGYGAKLGAVGSLGYLAQAVATVAGQSYVLSFWLDSPDGQVPNEFLVNWNGETIFDQVNLGAIGWTNMQLIVTAADASTVVEFGFRDDLSWLGLDDISLMPVPAFVSTTTTDSVLTLTWSAMPGLAYQVQYRTDLGQGDWMNLGQPVTATASTVITSDLTTLGVQRFYRVVLLP
jgi:hypothetical protein